MVTQEDLYTLLERTICPLCNGSGWTPVKNNGKNGHEQCRFCDGCGWMLAHRKMAIGRGMAGRTLIKLEKLWYGDHFSIPTLPDEIFCVIDVEQHVIKAINRTAAIKLKEIGYGHIRAGIMEFKRTEDVCFIPVHPLRGLDHAE